MRNTTKTQEVLVLSVSETASFVAVLATGVDYANQYGPLMNQARKKTAMCKRTPVGNSVKLG